MNKKQQKEMAYYDNELNRKINETIKIKFN